MILGSSETSSDDRSGWTPRRERGMNLTVTGCPDSSSILGALVFGSFTTMGSSNFWNLISRCLVVVTRSSIAFDSAMRVNISSSGCVRSIAIMGLNLVPLRSWMNFSAFFEITRWVDFFVLGAEMECVAVDGV